MEDKPIEPDVVKTRVQINMEKNKNKRKIAKEEAKTPLGKTTKFFRKLFFISLWISIIVTVLGFLCYLATFMWMAIIAIVIVCTLFLIFVFYPNFADGQDEVIEKIASFGTLLLSIAPYFWIVTAVLGLIWLIFGILRAKERKRETAQNTISGENTFSNKEEEKEQKTSIDGKEI